ncbi:hypothetical protein [Deinococcus sp. QL22]|uniref:hypothetical protein n=1 Tax=Deinococcus sp. QL22 TaxID=2939437 RepID=UPI002016CB98|nr:hypothetical protein [Deinococcus sp. QL22]UQN08911.1 hypothetical protein M1R55_20170 [Deinococcus sp. QL22]
MSADVHAVVTAAQELRAAKQFLQSGHLIKGVQRHERAKRELYQASHTLMTSGADQSGFQNLKQAEPFTTFLQALVDFRGAYEQRRANSTDSQAASALVNAIKNVISELDHVEGSLN